MLETVKIGPEKNITLNIPENGAIGAFMSGGADSSLLCFLLADTIKKNNLSTKIIAITCEMLARPYNIRCATDVLNSITGLTGFEFSFHLCYPMPNHVVRMKDEDKASFHGNHTRAFAQKFGISTIFNGLTANPPESEVPDKNGSNRQRCRDDINWRKKQEQMVGLSVPFIHLDKKDIATMYQKYDLLSRLLPMTRSCEGEKMETEYFTKTCFEVRHKGDECWWCRERKYGFQ
jgi:hypothetical protein